MNIYWMKEYTDGVFSSPPPSPYLPLKVLLTGYVLAALALALGDGDAHFFDVVYGLTCLIWWPVKSSNEGRFSSLALSCQGCIRILSTVKERWEQKQNKISPNFKGVFKLWRLEINSRTPSGHDRLSLYSYI